MHCHDATKHQHIYTVSAEVWQAVRALAALKRLDFHIKVFHFRSHNNAQREDETWRQIKDSRDGDCINPIGS